MPRCTHDAPCNDCCLCLSALPDGKTCADCVHAARCEAFGFSDSMHNTYCAFIPSRAKMWEAGDGKV